MQTFILWHENLHIIFQLEHKQAADVYTVCSGIIIQVYVMDVSPNLANFSLSFRHLPQLHTLDPMCYEVYQNYVCQLGLMSSHLLTYDQPIIGVN